MSRYPLKDPGTAGDGGNTGRGPEPTEPKSWDVPDWGDLLLLADFDFLAAGQSLVSIVTKVVTTIPKILKGVNGLFSYT